MHSTDVTLKSREWYYIIYKAFNYDRRKSNILTDDRTNKKNIDAPLDHNSMNSYIPSPVKPTDSAYFTMNRQSETKAILSINPDLFIQALSVMIDYVKLQRERQCVKTGNPLIHPITLC